MNGDRFDEIMESGALALGAKVLAEERLEPGRAMSHYRIVEEIGHGGMGVVYRAFDETLERDVALKVLMTGAPPLQEARAAAQLKHPNIGAVYEVGNADGVTFLAMELLDGESLAARLSRATLPPATALQVARDVVEGLAHAHDKGVVHRDLKPANVMLTPHGAKLIDFGLAGGDGAVGMGTPGYTAPELERGESGDARADIYSFGVLLERLNVPRISSVAARCVQEDPNDRWQSAAELRRGLETAAAPRSQWSRVAIVGVAIAVGVAAWLVRDRPSSIVLTGARQLTSDVGVEEHAQWSPDGTTVVYEANTSGQRDIWLLVPGGRPQNLTDDFDLPARYPSWSPDGTEITFWAARGTNDGSVMRMRRDGVGEPTEVARSDTESAPYWSSDGSELAFIAGDRIEVLTLSTGTRDSLPLPGASARRFDLSGSPDGRYFAYVDANAIVDEASRLWVTRRSDGAAFQITSGATNVWSPSWSPDSDELYFITNEGGGMDWWAKPVSDGEFTEAAVPLTVGVGIRNAALSADGTRLIYSKGRKIANVWRMPLLELAGRWEDAEQLTFDQALIEFVDVSPDRRTLAVSSDRSGNQDIWLVPLNGGDLLQVTTEPSPDWAPVWSPTGTDIAFYSYRHGSRDLWLVPAAGGAARALTSGPAEDYRMAFSPSGTELLFDSTRAGSWDIWSLTLSGGELRQVTTHDAVDSDAHVSPDGSRIVFGSLRTGTFRLWEIRAGGEPQLLSRGPARNPRFSPNGRAIYFHGDGVRSGNIWRLDLATGAETAVTRLEGRRGALGLSGLATDGEYLYFTWEEDLGDLWVLDVERR